jgi:hypothetical protein
MEAGFIYFLESCSISVISLIGKMPYVLPIKGMTRPEFFTPRIPI